MALHLVQITEREKLQFNSMLAALQKIMARETSSGLKESSGEFGLKFEEELMIEYDSILQEVHFVCSNIEPLK